MSTTKNQAQNLHPARVRSSSICQMVVNDLEKSGYIGPVVLTGSRYFGNTHAKSDWDFFIDLFQYYHGLSRGDLTDFGWKMVNTEYTKDGAINHVVEKKFFVGNIPIHVQVQVVGKFAAKCIAQKAIYEDIRLMEGLTISKERAKLIWENTIIESTAALRECHGRRQLMADEQCVVDYLNMLP